MASGPGYPSGREFVGFGYGGGSTVRVPLPSRSEAGGGIKRPMTETERLLQQQQQQMQMQLQLQREHVLRSVKQRMHLPSPTRPIDFSSPSSSTTTSSLGFGVPELPFSAAVPAPMAAAIAVENKPSAAAPGSVMKNRLEELERRLLLDDNDDDGEESALTGAEWSEAMEQLISSIERAPPPPSASTTAAGTTPLSPSPTNSISSSSTVSSTAASCSPNSSAAAPSSRQMLLDAAAALAEGNLEAANASVAALKGSSNPRGDPEQRLAAMMVSAIVSRINSPPSASPAAELCSTEHFVATQSLYELSPCFKLALFAANYAILDATKDQRSIHILDFEVGQGGHYAVLLHTLADRQRHRAAAIPPPSIKITAVADPASPFTNTNSASLRAVGDRIEKLAELARLPVRFNVVSRRVTELDAAALGCEPGEALAVNLPFVLSRVADESVSPANPRDELLRRVRALRPLVVVLLEQDINTNTAAFAGRFAEACGHYGALLQSLDAAAGRDSPERARVEAGLVRKLVNSIAREGSDRVERCEVFGKWRARMGMAGFRPVEFGPAVTDQVKARLASTARSNPGFTIKEDVGGPAVGLGFGWMGRTLTMASAWR